MRVGEIRVKRIRVNQGLGVFPSHQDRKTNSFIHFLGEVTVQQFCFEIYWPLAEKN